MGHERRAPFLGTWTKGARQHRLFLQLLTGRAVPAGIYGRADWQPFLCRLREGGAVIVREQETRTVPFGPWSQCRTRHVYRMLGVLES